MNPTDELREVAILLRCRPDEVRQKVELLLRAIQIPPVVVGIAYHPLIDAAPPSVGISSIPSTAETYNAVVQRLQEATDIVVRHALSLAKEET